MAATRTTRATQETGDLVPTPRLRKGKPDWAICYFKGFPHLFNLRALRRALLDRAIAGEDHQVLALAKAVKASMSTLSRLLSGRGASLDIVILVLRELNLEFDQVCLPLEGPLLERLQREGTIDRNGATFLTLDPMALPEAAGLAPRLASPSSTT